MKRAKRASTSREIQFWKKIIQERARSGTSIKSFCESKGFTPRQYYYWSRKVKKELPDWEPPAVVKETKPADDLEPLFLPVRFSNKGKTMTELESFLVELKSGHTIRAPLSIDRDQLSDLIAALEDS